MKKTIKSGIVAAVAVAAGFAAYQSYGSYGAQDNSLLMQNVEALADDNNGEPDGDTKGDPGSKQKYSLLTCYKHKLNKGIVSIVCPEGTHYPDALFDCPDPEPFVNPKGTTSVCVEK